MMKNSTKNVFNRISKKKQQTNITEIEREGNDDVH